MIEGTEARHNADELSAAQRELFERLLAGDDVELAAREPIPRRRDAGEVPPSFAQQRLWVLHQLDPRSSAYNMPSALRMEGLLDRRALALSLDAIVRRHESLRTTFHSVAGQPVQVVAAAARVALPVADLRAIAPRRRQAEAAALFQEEASRPFDLQAAPLLRTVLIEMDEGAHVLLFTMHHIASDGWSTGVLMRELGALYEAHRAGRPPALPELPIQYADFAVWQRQWLAGEVLESQLAYWREQLAGMPPVLDLPTDRPRPAVRRERGALEPLVLPADLLQRLKLLAWDLDATLFMVLLAGFVALLHRHTGQDDLAVGTPIAGRNRAETEGLIGFFVNTLVLRAEISGGPSFVDLVGRLREVSLGAYAHQDLPFERLIDELEPVRDLSRTPLFQVMFVLQNTPPEALELAGLRLELLELKASAAKFDLLLSIGEEAGTLAGTIEYDAALFDRSTVRRLASHLHQLLAAACAAPATAASLLPLASAAERHQILAELNDTAVPLAADLCLHDWIARQAAHSPEVVAVSFEGAALSYGELDVRARRLARHLRRLGVGPEVVVGICAERSVELMIGLLGILQAGGAYLPLDPSYPPERLAAMVEDVLTARGRPVLLHQGSLATLSAGWSARVGARQIDLDRLAARSDGESGAAAAAGAWPESTAYVIYTSGSTGKPKGVVNTHRGISNRLLWMQAAYGLAAGDVVLQKTPLSFDVSVWELFWPLMTGARLLLARPDGHRDSGYLVDLIEEQGITTLHFVPSMLQAFLEEPDLGRCASLRRVMASGEALPAELARRFISILGAELHNLYGPTEAAVDVTFHACRTGTGAVPSVPIGRPIDNLGIWLLDRGLQPVPLGVPGELYIGGMGLARGYHDRPGLTAERFVPHPASERPGERLYRTGDLARFLPGGEIQFLGRTDHQVKIRGFRIELGEIEAALAARPEVREAVVLAQDGPAGRRLMAYLVPWDAAMIGDPRSTAASDLPARLRGALKETLPVYMVPTVFVLLSALPLSVNGKLDRRRLELLGAGAARAQQEYVPPETAAEAALAEVWGEVLGLERVGAEDNFFALGGDSILSLRILAGAGRRGLKLELRQIFQHQTLRELAREARGGVCEEAQPVPAPFALISEADRRRLPEGLEDAWPLTHLQAGMLFHSEYSPETAVYHDILSCHLAAPFDAALFSQAVERLLAAHPILRTSFDLTSYGEPLQLVHRAVEPQLQVEDLRPLDPLAQEAAVAAWVEQEKALPFDWSRGGLLRFRLCRRTDDSFQFALAFHHSILDGWSVANLVAELFRIYLGLCRGEGRGEGAAGLEAHEGRYHSFLRFVVLERQALAAADERLYWHRVLAGAVISRLPRQGPATVERRGPARKVETAHFLSDDLSDRLRTFARRARVPVKSAFLAVHCRVLAALCGGPEVLTGLVTNGRPETAGGEAGLGLFLNTLPFRLSLPGGSWADLVRRVFEAECELLPHRRYPLAELQREAGGQPLFDVVFNYVHFHVLQGISEFPELQPLGGTFFEETNFDFVVSVRQDALTSRFEVALQHDTEQFGVAQAEAIGAAWLDALGALVVAPESPWQEGVAAERGLAPAVGNGAEIQPLRFGVARAVRKVSPRGYVAPRNAVEELVAALWQELLEAERIGVHDHFFDLGGHSVLATRIVSRVRQTFGLKLPLRAFLDLEVPTVAEMARLVVENETRPGQSEKLARMLRDVRAMSGDQVREQLQVRRQEARP